MPAYARGSKALGLCQRCGLRFLRRDLIFDGYFPNMLVCQGCYDPRQPQEFPVTVTDPEAIYRPSPDAYLVPQPFLTAAIAGSTVVLTWTSIGGRQVGDDNSGMGGAATSAGYNVFRSTDGGNTWAQVAALPNAADEFGALAIETLTWTDTAVPAGEVQYKVLGYDVLEGATYG